jgi:predicted metal-dependent peptidase
VESDLTSEEALSAAFMSAYRAYPYFSSGLAMLVRKIVELPSATMAVTRDGILLVDPRFLAAYHARQLAEVLAHELLHLLRNHAERSDRIPAVDCYRWNIASDCEINSSLQRAYLPGSPCLPGRFKLMPGLLAEEYYEMLPVFERSICAVVCEGGCGSGSGGERVDGEPAEGTEEGRSKADIVWVRQAVAAAIVEHAGQGAGTVPGDLLKWANGELRPPKINWRDKLRRIIRSEIGQSQGKVDYTWSRPSRRYMCQSAAGRSLGSEDVLLPSLRGWTPQIAIGLDTSGSMSMKQIEMAMAEIGGVLRAIGVSATFLDFDCELQAPLKKIRNVSDAISCLRGGGGTDFRVVLDKVVQLKPRPSLLIILTDGDGPAPEAPPKGVSVLWVLIGNTFKKPVEWGESVVIEEGLQ